MEPNKQAEETENPELEHPQLGTKVDADYTASSIQVLEGLEAVRKRPGMYVGDNGKKGLHQMFREVLDNSIDEAMAGHCDTIHVTIHRDESMTIVDNGRGIPVDTHEKEGVSALQVIMTKLHAGGKFGGGGYKVSGGLHGVGVSCTNALSEYLIAEVYRDGKVYRQRYEKGIPVTPVEEVGKTDKKGTSITWKADATVLTETAYDRHIIMKRLRELAYLNPNITIVYLDEASGEEEISLHFENGIVQLVEDLNDAATVIHKPIYIARSREDMEVEVAMQYNDGYHTNVLAYSNNIHQPDGGTHVSGFYQALTRIVNSYARKMNLLKEKDKNFQFDDVAEGITCVIALKLRDPSYNSQDKVKLVSPEVQGAMNSMVGEGLQTFLEENPAIGKKIVDKASIAQRAREEARKAAEAVKRSSAMDSYGLPGKLTDCISKNADECELFLVEGQSAGGNAKTARDRNTQAVLALRGKVINVEKARLDKALDNEEIKSMIAALGVGIDIDAGRGTIETDEDGEPVTNGKNGKGSFDLSKLRYNKIIIMTDADVDGEHIRTLLLTFFYRFLRPLIEAGHVYLVEPPLFVIKVGSNTRYYAADEEERDQIIKSLKGKKHTVTRFKGLGEMQPEELEETAMDPITRRLVQIKLDPEFEFEVEQIFQRLMGDRPEPRREFIEERAKQVTNIDWHY